ncbi:hypothetical protein HKD37_14G040451 [Glycine soja]
MANLESHPHSPTSSSAIPHTASPSNPYCIKLEVSHFDGSDPLYDNPTGALFKLTQRDTVNTYLPKLKALTNQIIGLPPPFLLSCFISCLVPEIHREVQALQPFSVGPSKQVSQTSKGKVQ